MFSLYSVFEDSNYEIKIVFRGGGPSGVRLELLKDGHPKAVTDAPASKEWRAERVAADGDLLVPYHVGAEIVGPSRSIVPAGFVADGADPGTGEPRRWPGEGTLTHRRRPHSRRVGRGPHSVRARRDRVDQATLTAQKADEFPVVIGVSLTGSMGSWCRTMRASRSHLHLDVGASATIALTLTETNLGDARYTFSVAAFRELTSQGSSRLYDLLDRGFEFEIFGNGPFENGVFNHPAEWRIDAGDRTAST